MKIRLIHILFILTLLPFISISQELPEGGEELVTKDQAKLFRDKKRVESLFFDANKAKVTDNPGQALALFREVVEIDPSHDASWYEIGLLFYKQRDIRSSIANIEKAYTLQPDNKWYAITLASLYSQNSQFNEAISVYEKLYKKNPSDRSNAFELANLYLKVNKSSEALKIYDQIEAREGITEEVSLNKHHIYLSEGKKKKALEELEKLAEANQWDSRIQSLLAEFYIMNGIEEKALATYEKILKIEPDNPYINISLADFYRKKGDLKKAAEALKKGFANQYLDASTKLQILSTYYSQTGNYQGIDDDILEISGILLEQHPYDPQVVALRAQLLAMRERYPESLSLFKKVSELDPGKYEVWENILRITALMEKYDSLVISSEEVIGLFPVQPMPYYFKAVGQLMQDKNEDALATLNTGIKLVFNNNSLMSEFYSMSGDALYKLKKNEEAYNSYENALRYNPSNALVLNNYAYYLSEHSKNLEKAEDMATKANELSPDNPTYLDTHAWVLYKQGKYSEALVLMDRALKLDPGASGTVLEHYGDILYKLNKKEDAMIWWKKALEAGDASELLPSKVKDGTLYE